MWQASAGALTYTLYRSTSTADETLVAIAGDLKELSYLDTGLVNGTTYYYRLRAFGPSQHERPVVASVRAPLTAAARRRPRQSRREARQRRVDLGWSAVTGATAYRIFRSTTGVVRQPVDREGHDDRPIENSGLTNGTTYSTRWRPTTWAAMVRLRRPSSATPVAPPPAPAGCSPVAGESHDHVVVDAAALGGRLQRVSRHVSREGSHDAAGGRRGGAAVRRQQRRERPDLLLQGHRRQRRRREPALGRSQRHARGSAARRRRRDAGGVPAAAAGDVGTAAGRRRSRRRAIGAAAFLDEQLAAPPSVYPDTLFDQPVEAAQEHFMRLALTGPDQLRQRVAWALHKIWVVSAVEVDERAGAIVTYYRAADERRVRQLSRPDARRHAQPRDGPLPEHAEQHAVRR